MQVSICKRLVGSMWMMVAALISSLSLGFGTLAGSSRVEIRNVENRNEW